MEQRIGPNIQPLQGAAADPAFIPGITGPRPAEKEAAEPEDAVAAETAGTEETPEKSSPAADASAEAGGTGTAVPAAAAGTDTGTVPGADAEEESEDEDGAVSDDDGPVFEASDRRASVRADRDGVRLRLDDQECEFRWDEIGAVETESPRFGRRFTLTVHTPDRRWYPIEIEATARARHKEWEASLDEVLDAYFDDGGDEAEAPEPADRAESAKSSDSEDEPAEGTVA